MLQLVLGRSGFGKTEWIHKQVADWAKNGTSPVYLLVPEQFSFETERDLLEELGAKAANRIQVISFSRLAEILCPQTNTGRMNDTVRTLLMSEALEACTDRLQVYRRHIADPEYIACLLTLLTECKQNGITPSQLQETANSLPDNTLKHKTEELGWILEAYEALAGQSYVDPLDDLSTLAEHLQSHPLSPDTCIAVDGFYGFTRQELTVLQRFMEQAAFVTVALCTDHPASADDLPSPFMPVAKTASRLINMARDAHIEIKEPVHLTTRIRTDDIALNHLEKTAFEPPESILEDETDSVTMLSCEDIYAECEAVARLIRKQVRETGCRYREFSIVTRQLNNYKGVLDAALEKQGIAYYLDDRENVMTDSLFALTTAALQMALGDWNVDLFLRIAKSGLVGLSSHSIAILENYLYIWRINGSRLRQEWTDHPEGLSLKFDDAAVDRLHHLNLLRERLTKPLERLAAALHSGSGLTGEEFGRAIYRYLTDVKADKFLRMQVAGLEKAGEHATADRTSRLWGMLITLLDTFAQTLQSRAMKPTRLVDLFRLVVSTTDMGVIPQSIDCVQIGSADRIRYASPRTLFMLGVNEGGFPAYPSDGNLWTVSDRRRLVAAGLPLNDTDDDALLQEWLYAYYAMAAPSEQLYISWIRTDTGGESALPSTVVENTGVILPHCRRMDTTAMEDYAESATDLWHQVAKRWREDSVFEASLKEALTEDKDHAGRMQMLSRIAEEMPMKFDDPAVSCKFFGDDMRISPSRVEVYHQCRFAYFCQYGLRAKPRKPADFDSLAFGTLAHYVMEQLLPTYTETGFDKIHRPRVAEDIRKVVDEYIEEFLGGVENRTPRFLHQLDQLKVLCARLMWQVVMELRQSRFVPTDFELPISHTPDEKGAQIDPIVLTLADGATIRVQGQVDRVDVYERDGLSYVRVIDYKTGSKEFRMSDVVEGINLQMLIYMMSIWQNGGKRYGDVRPAGLLYLPAKLPVLKVDRSDVGEDNEKAQLKAMKMNGLLLDDPLIIEAMEVDAGGLFIPASLTQKGEFSRGSSVASLEKFGRLKQKVEKLLTNMADTLRQGDIAAVPAVLSEKAVCEYCPYKAVCGFEEGLPMRYIAKKDAETVWAELAEEVDSRE